MHEDRIIRDESHLDIEYIFEVILLKKKIIIFCFIIGFILSSIYAFNTPSIYKSESLLAPSTVNDSLSTRARGLSALGGIAGFLPNEPASKSQEAIERIKSFDFFKNNVLPNIKLEDLTAATNWDSVQNKILYDDGLYNSSDNNWIYQDSKPSEQDAYKNYINILSVSENKQTLFVTISIEHYSPYIAKEWLDVIIFQINNTVRDIDKLSAENSVNFLKNLFIETNLVEIKEVLSQVLAEQIQKLMLAEANNDYVFKIISSPLAPQASIKPNRPLIVLSGSFLFLVIGILIAFILNFLSIRNK